MYIIKIKPSESGSRPPLQTWDNPNLPDGYAYCTEEQKDVFYSSSPAGFVDVTFKEVEGYQGVDTIAVNQTLVDRWNEEHPVLPESDPEPTQLDKIEAQVVYSAMMSDTLIEEA